MVLVNVKRLHPDAVIPHYAHEGDAGFDLVAIESTWVYPRQTTLVSTGLGFEIPPGYEMQIRPRSGISGKTPLRIPNSPGTVDSGFRGEIKILVECATGLLGQPYYIEKGARIAQGVIKRVPEITFVEVDELEDSERGTNGFGSSGWLEKNNEQWTKLYIKMNE